jgi:hypothetical protein
MFSPQRIDVGTAKAALELAASFVGYREGPRNNETIFGEYTGYQFQPWCGSYVKYCLDKTGTVGEPSPVYTPAGVIGYRNSNRWISRNGNPKPGDVVFFDFQRGPGLNPYDTDHVGLLEAADRDGILWVLEGNTSSGAQGSQSDGGGCFRRARHRADVFGFGRPAYTVSPPVSTEEQNMNRLIDTPNGTTWLCSGGWRTKVSADDAAALQFVGTPRQKVDQRFADIVERTLADTKWAADAAWFSKFGPAK